MGLRPKIVALLVVVALPSALRAQEPDAEARRRAGELFHQGEESSSASRWEEALDFFRQSEAAAPHPATRYNVAVCLEKLGRLVEAEDVLHELQSSDNPPTVRSAEEALARIGPLLATLRVNAGDADIMVDGSACAVPCERRVQPGEHAVEVTAAGGRRTESVAVAAGETHAVDLFVATPPPPAPTPAAPPPRPRVHENRWDRFFFWGGVGIAAVGAATTAVFGYQALSLQNDLEDARATGPAPEQLDSAHSAATLANVGLVIAGIGAVAIGLSLLLDLDDEDTEAP